ncbi:MAG TPA: AI-2E family transporter, partial [Fimbriimonadaceae bacterium]|nr:AI-2E family transporter [Fimbriimonadaceae bacterium]
MKDFAEKYNRFGFFALAGLVGLYAFWMVLPFMPAILWAVVLSVLMNPLYQRFRKRFSENWSAVWATLLALSVILIPLIIIGVIVAVQVTQFAQGLAASAPEGESAFSMHRIMVQLDEALRPTLQSLGAKDFSLEQWLNNNRESLTRAAGNAAPNAIKSLGYTLFTLVIAFLTMFFMLRDGHRLRGPALDIIPLDRNRSQAILDRIDKTIHGVFVGVVLVAIAQGGLAGIAYYFTGVPSPVMWSVATMFFCTIPLLGAPFIYVPLSAILFSQGKNVEGLVLLGVGFGIVSQIDNVLKPFVIGARIELHPMAIFFSLLGGVFALGPVGIMVGPVLLSILLGLHDALRERLVEDTVASE